MGEDLLEIAKVVDEVDIRNAQGTVVAEGGAAAKEHRGVGRQQMSEFGDFRRNLGVIAGINGAEGNGARFADDGTGGDFFSGQGGAEVGGPPAEVAGGGGGEKSADFMHLPTRRGKNDLGDAFQYGITAAAESEEIAHHAGGEVFVNDAHFAFAPGFANFLNQGGDDVEQGGAGAVTEQGLLKQRGHGGGFQLHDGLKAAFQALGGRRVMAGGRGIGKRIRAVFFMEGVKFVGTQAENLADAVAAVGQVFQEAEAFDFFIGIQTPV